MTPVATSAPRVKATSGRGDPLTVDVGLVWYPNDPFIVFMHVGPRGCKGSTWLLDRDTLAAGLDGPVGVGDWSMFPDLSRRDGKAVEMVLALVGGGVGRNLGFPLMVGWLRRFLDDTYQVVPADVALDFDTAELEGQQ